MGVDIRQNPFEHTVARAGRSGQVGVCRAEKHGQQLHIFAFKSRCASSVFFAAQLNIVSYKAIILGSIPKWCIKGASTKAK